MFIWCFERFFRIKTRIVKKKRLKKAIYYVVFSTFEVQSQIKLRNNGRYEQNDGMVRMIEMKSIPMQ